MKNYFSNANHTFDLILCSDGTTLFSNLHIFVKTPRNPIQFSIKLTLCTVIKLLNINTVSLFLCQIIS